jgi:lipopolysaccharide/colanic/teichoic acid biosynthesis glycosyltransferase
VSQPDSDTSIRRSKSYPPDAPPAFYQRRKKRSDEVGQLLVNSGELKPESLREALRVQEEHGGHLGAILVKMGACSPRAIADAIIKQAEIRRACGNAENVANLARSHPAVVGLRVPCRPRITWTIVVAADIVALFAGSMLGSFIAYGSHVLEPVCWFRAAAVTMLCLLAYWLQHLYATPPPSAPDEMRRVSYSTSAVCIALIAFSLISMSRLPRSNAALIIGCGVSIVLVLLVRALVRFGPGRRPWWGRPVVVFGAGKTGRTVVRTLQAHPELGLKPIAMLDDDPSKHGTLRAHWGSDDIEVKSVRSAEYAELDRETDSARAALGQFALVEGVPIIGTLDLAPVVAQRLGIQTAVVALNDLHTEDLGGTFKRVLIVPELFRLEYRETPPGNPKGEADSLDTVHIEPQLFGFEYLGDPTRNLAGVLGIELRQQLLLRWPRIAKRTLDVVLTVVGGLLVLPVLGLLALMIVLDSPGPVFYPQKRLGRHGSRFEALKFRTMFGDGERRLQQVLDADPDLRAEYEEFHKLTNDPRITRFGRLLRKYSLDELPQIYNVLTGDMSLVGPRPYLAREIPVMDLQEGIILRVRPGITGLWQVSDRNVTTFRQRLRMDVEYVRNWSPWLDLYILMRTVGVVLSGAGT